MAASAGAVNAPRAVERGAVERGAVGDAGGTAYRVGPASRIG